MAKASRARDRTKALSLTRMASRARTAIQASKETSRITAKASSRTAASRVASRETRRAVTRTATTRMVRTSNSRARPKATIRASRDPLQTSSRASN